MENRPLNHVYKVEAQGRIFGKFLDRASAELAVPRYASGYKIPSSEFTVECVKEYN